MKGHQGKEFQMKGALIARGHSPLLTVVLIDKEPVAEFRNRR
jgi:hypothetical protein